MAIGEKKRALMEGDTTYDMVGAAPAGYGLGEHTAFVTDLNEANRSGFYHWSATAVNAPFEATYGGGEMIVIAREQDFIYQYAFDNTSVSPSMCVREKVAGKWTPWEWVNPLMEPDVEYRTTERYLGKPVYAKTISLGEMPNNTINEQPHGISNIGYITHLSGTMSYGSGYVYVPQSGGGASFDEYIGISSSTVWIVTTKDRTNFTAYVIIKYTKNTD